MSGRPKSGQALHIVVRQRRLVQQGVIKQRKVEIFRTGFEKPSFILNTALNDVSLEIFTVITVPHHPKVEKNFFFTNHYCVMYTVLAVVNLPSVRHQCGRLIRRQDIYISMRSVGMRGECLEIPQHCISTGFTQCKEQFT